MGFDAFSDFSLSSIFLCFNNFSFANSFLYLNTWMRSVFSIVVRIEIMKMCTYTDLNSKVKYI